MIKFSLPNLRYHHEILVYILSFHISFPSYRLALLILLYIFWSNHFDKSFSGRVRRRRKVARRKILRAKGEEKKHCENIFYIAILYHDTLSSNIIFHLLIIIYHPPALLLSKGGCVSVWGQRKCFSWRMQEEAEDDRVKSFNEAVRTLSHVARIADKGGTQPWPTVRSKPQGQCRQVNIYSLADGSLNTLSKIVIRGKNFDTSSTYCKIRVIILILFVLPHF